MTDETMTWQDWVTIASIVVYGCSMLGALLMHSRTVKLRRESRARMAESEARQAKMREEIAFKSGLLQGLGGPSGEAP